MSLVAIRLFETLWQLGAQPELTTTGDLIYNRDRVSEILQRQVDQREEEIASLLSAGGIRLHPTAIEREAFSERMAAVLEEIEDDREEQEELREREEILEEEATSPTGVELPRDRRRWPKDASEAFWQLVKDLNRDARDRDCAVGGRSPWALVDAERVVREVWRRPLPLDEEVVSCP